MPDILVSFDPGLREMGVAMFRGGHLDSAGLLRGEADTSVRDVEASRAMAQSFDDWLSDALLADERPDHFAYEKMKHYSKSPKANVDDLFQLVGVSHACLRAYEAPVSPIKPGTWTSGRPKDINHQRIDRRLDTEEGDALAHAVKNLPEGDHEHVYDAVGIGLYELKRLV
jgi:hypothetical protein